MRLVDADKQLEWVDCMKPIHGIGLEPVVAVETVRDLVKGAPTIDAIPVGWLEARKTEYLDDWGEEPVSVEAALRILQKEQEAR